MRVLGIALGIALGVGLAGCSTAPKPPPISQADLAGMVVTIDDAAWASVDYQEAVRPTLRTLTTLSDDDWVGAAATCMTDRGFDISITGDQIDFVGGQGQPFIDFAVSKYACTVIHPRAEALAQAMNQDQRGALYDYYWDYVAPCLALSGVKASPRPQRDVFVRDPTYEPYTGIAEPPGIDDGVLREKCPPVPGWLNVH